MLNFVLFINTPLSPSFASHGGTLTLVDISIRPSDYSTHEYPLIQTSIPLVGTVLSFQPHLLHFSNILTSLLANSTDDIWLDDVTDSVVITSSNFDRCNACCTNTLFSSRFRTLFTLDCSFSHLATNEGQQTLSGTTQLIGDVFASISRNGKEEPSIQSIRYLCRSHRYKRCFHPAPQPAAQRRSRLCIEPQGRRRRSDLHRMRRHSGGAIATTAAQLTVSDSAFYTCKAICHAWIEEEEMSHFEVIQTHQKPSCLFESCLAPSFGVVLYPYGCAAPEFFRMVICMFLGTTVSTIKTERSGGQIVMIACSRFIVDDVEGYNYFRDELNNQDGVQTKRKEGLFTETEGIRSQEHPIGYVWSISWIDGGIHGCRCSCRHIWIERWDCGSSSKRCETVTFAGNKVKTNYKVIVAAGEYSSENEDETCILVNTKIVESKGRDRRQPAYKSKHVGATNKPTAQLTSSSQHPSSTKESKYCAEDHFKVSWQNNAADNLRFKASHAIRVQSTGDEDSFLLRESDGAVRGHFEVSWQDYGLQDAPCHSCDGICSFEGDDGHRREFHPAGTRSNLTTLQITTTPLLSTSSGSCMLQSCSFKLSGSVVAAQTLISVLAIGTFNTNQLRGHASRSCRPQSASPLPRSLSATSLSVPVPSLTLSHHSRLHILFLRVHSSRVVQ
ncbi:hypothetical protein BLNAU_25034 [Blattamonas nauphoetae]|uniref:Uncharacterized protein n=1 Tax=Blattamonas nauphoetae TaxID=2049346 RepID=A0ABQ9WKQ2_9EUKA|nr:hypothetical protein BLNAU_25034 [Blattamonas nauphoetae]